MELKLWIIRTYFGCEMELVFRVQNINYGFDSNSPSKHYSCVHCIIVIAKLNSNTNNIAELEMIPLPQISGVEINRIQ
jgi:hypothetical protein